MNLLAVVICRCELRLIPKSIEDKVKSRSSKTFGARISPQRQGICCLQPQDLSFLPLPSFSRPLASRTMDVREGGVAQDCRSAGIVVGVLSWREFLSLGLRWVRTWGSIFWLWEEGVRWRWGGSGRNERSFRRGHRSEQ